MARAALKNVAEKLEEGHIRSGRPGDCRASSSRDRGSTTSTSRPNIPAACRFCVNPAQIVPSHNGVEHLLREQTMRNWCPRLIASSTLLVGPLRAGRSRSRKEHKIMWQGTARKHLVAGSPQSVFEQIRLLHIKQAPITPQNV